MEVNFIVKGRLGNAIFRYMAAAMVCIAFNGIYVINRYQSENLSDSEFFNIFIKNNKKSINSVNMDGYYQHDFIYKYYKNDIMSYIKNNPSHYILTDGIKAGDTNCEKFFMIDILNTSLNFNKKYKFVLHLRLEDFVTHNFYIRKERIVEILKNVNFDCNEVCIVCNKCETAFEIEYINYICNFLNELNFKIIFESNDVLTDYYIMKEAEILICSNSTLSWCAAFFSDKIKLCYFPDYNIEQFDYVTCKRPIDNTILY
jgi:hypothetical protein